MSYAIAEQLRAAGLSLYRDESSNAKYDAQRNLAGRTHFADDATLRFHKSRILAGRVLHGGAFYYLRESTALTMDGSQRGHRVVLFDIFGNVINKVGLDDCATSGAAAERDFWEWFELFNVEEYYIAALYDLADAAIKESKRYSQAADSIATGEVAA